jgi:hypothetical protein
MRRKSLTLQTKDPTMNLVEQKKPATKTFGRLRLSRLVWLQAIKVKFLGANSRLKDAESLSLS